MQQPLFNQGQPQPYYPPQQPPMPPPQKKKPFYRRPLGCTLLIATLLACGLIGIISTAHGTSGTPDTANISHPARTPVSTQQATPPTKPTTQPISAITHGKPQLAGPISDFFGKYGKPSVTVQADGSQTWITGSDTNALFINARPDPHSKVTYISVVGPTTWNTQQTMLSCTQFLPSDATAFNKVSNITDYHSHAGMVVLRIEAAGSCTLYLAEQ